MHQKDFALNSTIRKLEKWKFAAEFALSQGLSEELVVKAMDKAKEEHENVKKMMVRKSHIQAVYFNLNTMSEQQQLKDFRFLLPEIRKISETLDWNGVTSRNLYACESTLACSIFLFRLATNGRWYDCESKFGMHSSKMSEIFWEQVEVLDKKCGKLLELRPQFLKSRCSAYAAAISEAGAPLDECIGFIDCTKIKMARPGGRNSYQRSVYSGHKRFHCLSYQSLTTPDGLLFALFGPVPGRHHDLTTLRKSGWATKLETNLLVEGRQFYLFGDSAYSLRPWMQRPFIGNCNGEQNDFNRRMSAVRVSVEHTYKDLKQQWQSQDYPRNLKVRKSPVGLLYRSAALLWNFRTCFYGGGQVEQSFMVKPPTFEEYRHSLPELIC